MNWSCDPTGSLITLLKKDGRGIHRDIGYWVVDTRYWILGTRY